MDVQIGYRKLHVQVLQFEKQQLEQREQLDELQKLQQQGKKRSRSD